jgi:hypothetical protein
MDATRFAGGLCLFLACAARAGAQPTIEHTAIECIEPGKFAVVLSGIDPVDEVQTAKVYFRSSLYPDFYYVEMTRDADRFVGVLPQVSPETPEVVYYLEAIDSVFESSRSREFLADVDDCDDDPAAAYYTGSEPGIIVGATTAGSSALPPGFSAIGIVGTITAVGVSSGVGGGVGAGVAVAAAVGAAGVAGAVVATSPGESSTTTVVAAQPSTTVATTSVPPSGSPSPSPSTTTVTTSITTTTVAPGGTTTVPGPSTTTVPGPSTTTTSTPTSTTSSSSSTTTTSAPPLDASCFTVQVLGDCKVRLNATCVSPPVDRYDWVLDTQDKFKRVTVSNGPAVFDHTWSGDDCGDGSTITFSLTVYRGGSSSSATKSIYVPGNDLKALPEERLLPLKMAAMLELSSSGERGKARIALDGLAVQPVVSSGQPVELRVDAAAGKREVAAVIVGGRGEPGLLRLDLSATLEVVSGSLRATEGNVLTQGPRAVTFRLAGQPGETVRFTFELR